MQEDKTTKKGKILVVDDTPANIKLMVEHLSQEGYKTLVAEDGESAIEQVAFVKPDLILLDVMMPGIDGFETCHRLKEDDSTKDIPIIFMTALSDTENKVKAFSMGAVDYVTKPIQHKEVLSRVSAHLTIRKLQKSLEDANQNLEHKVNERTSELKQALQEVQDQLQQENLYLKQEIRVNNNFEEIVTQSDDFRLVLQQIEQVAPSDATVLILGETGTGKELLARAVHNNSQRREKTLVKVNCASLPANLIESELFGHEKGAFTGAIAKKIGRFELADKGSIFLDEIGELPLELQSKLLRVLQEGEFERLGNPRTTKVDVRIIAATNRDLDKEVEKGTFRSDLYYRLNVFPINVPPLRERKEDVTLLASFFAQKYGKKIGKTIKSIPKRTADKLTSYDWPGNIRELENIIERAVIISQSGKLEVGNWFNVNGARKPKKTLTLVESEKALINEVLKMTKGQISGEKGAAKILDIKPTTLRSRMEKLGIRYKN
ncbi:sigma-54-dependent transcriptional regulator [Microscilla marina]|uniref:Transcriptional regulator, NifA subfamily, Fis Family n=1 Tax=Microscilla marina ATCC 23134 TaxID=313606 RepID=A1ZPF6_MICM2|nr:sigma-54 dependent transcriptional regulator [Microscilla marina]EAY27695.1 transcriptional regulator, NifA subfamily, Fis Family [Microscilla marina ATCC 23134]